MRGRGELITFKGKNRVRRFCSEPVSLSLHCQVLCTQQQSFVIFLIGLAKLFFNQTKDQYHDVAANWVTLPQLSRSAALALCLQLCDPNSQSKSKRSEAYPDNSEHQKRITAPITIDKKYDYILHFNRNIEARWHQITNKYLIHCSWRTSFYVCRGLGVNEVEWIRKTEDR